MSFTAYTADDLDGAGSSFRWHCGSVIQGLSIWPLHIRFGVDTPPGRLFSPYLECKVARRRLVVHVPADKVILASVHCMYRGRVDA
jgi:hypothetical protein